MSRRTVQRVLCVNGRAGTVDGGLCLLNGEREVGEGSREPVVRVEVNGQFVVAAAQTWHVR